jgi:hypothetical protein
MFRKLVIGFRIIFLISILMIAVNVFAGCWGISESCDGGCTYSSMTPNTRYSDFPTGCAPGACAILAETLYLGSGSCSGDGTGSCYKEAGTLQSAWTNCIGVDPMCCGGHPACQAASGSLISEYDSYETCDWIATDTCTCPGVDTNWEINMSDNCNLTEICDLGTGNLTFVGSGTFSCNISLNVSRFGDPGPGGVVFIESDCHILIE